MAEHPGILQRCRQEPGSVMSCVGQAKCRGGMAKSVTELCGSGSKNC